MIFCISVGGGSDLRLWTVNGDLVGHVHCREIICSVAFSNQPEGVSINVIAGGLENGVVRWADIPVFIFNMFLVKVIHIFWKCILYFYFLTVKVFISMGRWKLFSSLLWSTFIGYKLQMGYCCRWKACFGGRGVRERERNGRPVALMPGCCLPRNIQLLLLKLSSRLHALMFRSSRTVYVHNSHTHKIHIC